MSFTFQSSDYARVCVMCGYVPNPGYSWEERPQLVVCPRCGIDLEVLACRHCGGPLAMERESGLFGFGSGSAKVMPFCGHCGAPTAPPREAKHRDKPTSKTPAKEEDWFYGYSLFSSPYAHTVTYRIEAPKKPDTVEGFEPTALTPEPDDDDDDDDENDD